MTDLHPTERVAASQTDIWNAIKSASINQRTSKVYSIQGVDFAESNSEPLNRLKELLLQGSSFDCLHEMLIRNGQQKIKFHYRVKPHRAQPKP